MAKSIIYTISGTSIITRTLGTEDYTSVQGVKNYFTDSLFYQDSLETNENLYQEDLDSGNEADTKPKAEEKCSGK